MGSCTSKQMGNSIIIIGLWSSSSQGGGLRGSGQGGRRGGLPLEVKTFTQEQVRAACLASWRAGFGSAATHFDALSKQFRDESQEKEMLSRFSKIVWQWIDYPPARLQPPKKEG